VWQCADAFIDALSITLTKGPAFKYLPLPKAKVEGRYQWELPTVVKKETLLQRALIGAPLLVICYGATQTIGVVLAQLLPLLGQAANTSLFHVGDGSTIQMPSKISGVPSIDPLLKSLIAFFLPSLAGTDPIGRLQAIALLSDVSVIGSITTIESFRTGNAYTYVQIMYVVLRAIPIFHTTLPG
jgi:hypothetical protein